MQDKELSGMKRILILDDEVAVRESFADFFEDHLWDVVQAGSGEEALEILEHETVQAAIVDVRLPGMDGNEFIRTMCQRTDSIAFVICTGSPEYLVPEDLLSKRCVSDVLMKKPISSFDEPQRLIEETLRQIRGDKR